MDSLQHLLSAAAAASGKKKEINRFYTTCFDILYEKVFFISHSILPLEAEDLTSEIFQKILELEIQVLYKHKNYIEKYFLKLAWNHAKTHYRLYKNKKTLPIIEDLDVITTKSRLSPNTIETMIDLEFGLSKIPLNQKRVIELLIKGFSHKEISSILNISIGTSKNLVYLGKKNLKVVLTRHN